MLHNTTQKKQMMRLRAADWETRPNNGTGVVTDGDDATAEDGTTVDGQEDILADDVQGDHSTGSTEGSRDKEVFHLHASPFLEAETDPTSIPSGHLDDLDDERKCADSPSISLEVVFESDSIHSEESAPSIGDRDSRENITTAVNPGKVKGIGDHFGESSAEISVPRFHDPKDSWEAQHINERVKLAKNKLDDIDRHPKERFRDPGISYQVSARPEASAEFDLDLACDIARKCNVHPQPDPLLHCVMEERSIVQRPGRQTSPCCIMM